MASPPTASPKTRSRSASSRASTTRSASSSAAPTVYATRNVCGSRCSHACFQRSEVAKNTHTTSRRPSICSRSREAARADLELKSKLTHYPAVGFIRALLVSGAYPVISLPALLGPCRSTFDAHARHPPHQSEDGFLHNTPALHEPGALLLSL